MKNYKEEIAKRIWRYRWGDLDFDTQGIDAYSKWEWDVERNKCYKLADGLLPKGLIDLLALLDEAKCPECGGEGETVADEDIRLGRTETFKSAKEVIDYLHSPEEPCPTCKGTGQDPHKTLALVDTEAKMPEVEEDNPFVRLDEQAKIHKAGFKRVIRIL